MATSLFDPMEFRRILGHYPTGVCVVTSIDAAGHKSGMVVGSFTSISLDPPLVGFFPDKASRTWSQIERSGGFCVNVLGSAQLEICQRFTARAEDKFDGLEHGLSLAGMPLIDGGVAWIDCSIERVIELGDHWLVVGKVEALGAADESTPLLFHRGAYHDIVALDG